MPHQAPIIRTQVRDIQSMQEVNLQQLQTNVEQEDRETEGRSETKTHQSTRRERNMLHPECNISG